MKLPVEREKVDILCHCFCRVDFSCRCRIMVRVSSFSKSLTSYFHLLPLLPLLRPIVTAAAAAAVAAGALDESLLLASQRVNLFTQYSAAAQRAYEERDFDRRIP